MLVELDDEHTKCSICNTEFSCDRDNQDPDSRQHLPVLSSSQRCDHWFCHGCILQEQQRVAQEENDGKVPKWIKCMHCREKTSFNPAEPMYHRLLIDLLARAQKYAAQSDTAMIVELADEHTTCSICTTKFSCDRGNKDPEIRQHLPVLSSSQRCDHWFCHGCVSHEQQRVAEANNGRVPKWIKCMHCREKTSFNPAEPKYHRLLIDLLARAQKYEEEKKQRKLKEKELKKKVYEEMNNFLSAWLLRPENVHSNPIAAATPTREAKEWMATHLGVDRKIINGWFYRKRKKLKSQLMPETACQALNQTIAAMGNMVLIPAIPEEQTLHGYLKQKKGNENVTLDGDKFVDGNIPPDHVVVGPNTDDRKARRKVVKKRSYAKGQRIKKIKELKQVSSDEFYHQLLIHVYLHDLKQKKKPKMELEEIPEEQTLYGYLKQRGRLFVTLVGDNKSQVETFILPWCWYDDQHIRAGWDKPVEKDAKKEMNHTTGSHAWNLRGVWNMNVDEASRDKEFMMEYEEEMHITFGSYNEREYSFSTKFEVLDAGVIADYVIPGFFQGSSTNSYDENDSILPPRRVFWNGQSIDTSKLLCVKLKDADRYVLIDQAKPSERNLVIDNLSLKKKKVAFYRVGDFLTQEEINRVIATCSKCKHALPTFIYICVKYRRNQLRQKHLQSTKIKKIVELDREAEIIDIGADFIKALRDVLSDNYELFSISEFFRLYWVSWSSFGRKYDKMFTNQWSSKRRNARTRAIRHVPENETAQRLEDIKQLDNTTIVSIMQHGTDQSIFRAFQCISDGFDSLQSYLRPLEQIYFDEYFEVMVEMCRPFCELYTTTASTVLSIFVVSAVLFDGKVPTESVDILSFWQLNKNKGKLIRNCMRQIYDGVGVDPHVAEFLRACAKLKGVTELSKDDIDHLGDNIPEDPGAYLRELVGECTQSYSARKDAGDLRWQKWQSLLKKVSMQKEEFKQIIDIWLPDWEE